MKIIVLEGTSLSSAIRLDIVLEDATLKVVIDLNGKF